MFDIYYTEKTDTILERFPFAKPIQDLNNKPPRTRMYWKIDHSVNVIDYTVFDYRPESHDQQYTHTWKNTSGNYGGIFLIPRKESAGLKHIPTIVCERKTDVIRDITQLDAYFDNNIADWVWVADPDYLLPDQLEWLPDTTEKLYNHNFKLPGQLYDRYPENEGGLTLYNRSYRTLQTKYHGKMTHSTVYPLMYMDYDVFTVDNKDLTNERKLRALAKKSTTDWFWVIDNELHLTGKLNYFPSEYDRDKIHVFKAPGQLEYRYPAEYTDPVDNRAGGVRLVPKNFASSKYIPDVNPIQHDIFFADKPKQYAKFAQLARTPYYWVVPASLENIDDLQIVSLDTKHTLQFNNNIYFVQANAPSNKLLQMPDLYSTNTEYDIQVVTNTDITDVDRDTWIVDEDYDIHPEFEWKPPYHQRNAIHTFHVPGQLAHKYPEAMGGIRWVPASWNGDYVIHDLIEVKHRQYKIKLTSDVDDYAQLKGEAGWLVDEDYMIELEIEWTPDVFEREMIHTFHVPGQLAHKYPEAMGGIRWVPSDWQNAEIKIHKSIAVKHRQYKIKLTSDVDDYAQLKGEAGWLVDKDYTIETTIEWTPNVFERDMIHSFKLAGQLEHKYPEPMGGIRWVPSDWQNAEIKIHDTSPFVSLQFDVYSSIEEGEANSNKPWFWVVEPDVELLPDFDLSFIPDVWDAGKIHVWQKINPKTNKQYDYGGVSLVPLERKSGRPKYIRQPGCIQKEFPVYHLTSKRDVAEQLREFDRVTDNSAFYVVDPHVRIADDFDFDYYPTQWDRENVHIFQRNDGEHCNVRLYPKGSVTEDMTTEDLDYMPNVKQVNTIASMLPTWPVETLTDLTKESLCAILNSYAKQDVPYVFTVDPDVTPMPSVIENGFIPDAAESNKVHLWQRLAPNSSNIHSYGGLRLWPTSIENITTDGVRLSKMKNLRYVKKPGAIYTPYSIVFISYHDPLAEKRYKALTERYGDITWIKDVDGIFEAHKAAAEAVNTQMFWVIDSDADVVDDFSFDYIPDQYDQTVVHVWNSRNPITGMEYGYGGIKLFNTQQVRDATSWGLDFTTGLSSRFKVMSNVSCVTRFNVDALSTWRSAFRESVKLTLNGDAESLDRLQGWLHPVPNAEFRHDAKRGAEEGVAFAKEYKDNSAMLARINDYEWLEKRWNKLN